MANNTNLGAAKVRELYESFYVKEKKAVYAQQMAAAKEKGESNCQMLCKQKSLIFGE